MEVETPRSGPLGMGNGGGGGRDILEGYRDRVKRGVTFSDISKTDFESDDWQAYSHRRIYPSREYGDSRELGLQDWRRSMETGTASMDSTHRGRRHVDSMEKSFRLPRIIVRDVVGRQLDTFTTLQEAIYRAQWNVKSTCESVTPREWRLPKAPLPSRPDYSRQGPKVSKRNTELRHMPRAARSLPPGSVVEIGVEDVSYVAESLRHLPKLETFRDLFSTIGGGHERVYFHIVARLLLHQKIYTSDDKREAFYEFPGFCTGCRRAGFCYACRKGGTNFHIHHDQPVRTGGGFTYWKRDRPDNPDQSKHPSHWGKKIPESEIRLLLNSDKSMSQAAKDALRKRLISQYPWLQDMALDEMNLERMKELGLVLTTAEMAAQEDMDDVDKDTYGPGELYGEDPNLDLLGYTRMEKFLQARDAARKKYTIKLRKPVQVPPIKVEESETNASLEKQGTERRSRSDGERLGGWGSDSMYESSYIDDTDRDEEDKENTEADTTKKRLYKAPKFFQLKKAKQRSVVSRSPFSNNREYDIPKGKPIDIKKSERATTKFVEFNRSGSNWKEPKKFELNESDKKTTKFWQPGSGGAGDGRGKGRSGSDQENAYRSAIARKRKELDRSLSPDSGLDSEVVAESVKESTIDTYRDATSLPNTETDQELSGLTHDSQYDSGKEASSTESPRDHLSPDTTTKKKRSAIIKKTRSPIPYRKEKSSPVVTPEPEVEETLVDDVTPEPPSRERSMTPPSQEQYVPDIGLPDLPQYRKEQRGEEKKSKVQKFFVEAPPAMKSPPKKRKSPPKVRRLPKVQYKRKSKPAEAPVTTETLQDVSDPLDFLAKYCIINPNRLPFYEIIFENMVAEETPKYEKAQQTPDELPEREDTEVKVKGKGKKKKSEKKSEEEISEHELKLARDMMLINHRHIITDKIGLSPPEEYREKILYTLDTLQDKSVTLEQQLTQLDVQRISVIAEGTRLLFPDVCAHDYVPPDKKKGKKGKKSKKEKDSLEVITPRRRGDPIPDYVIVDRLTDAQMTTLSEEPEVRQLNLERERTQEKMKDVQSRIQQLEGEKLLFDILCTETFFEDQTENQRPSRFRRQQSHLYNKLRPDPDYELDLDTVEEALQQINNHLLTDQEFKYLYFILNLPGRSRINFRLFSVIAALSEKVTQMDPVIRNLLNKFDYNALDVKMEKCKDLFSLLEDDKLATPNGGAPASNLALELTAGGLKPEHTSYVLSKFNREGKGTFDFMDFVTYIPLFIEIHQRIIKDPLCEEHDL